MKEYIKNKYLAIFLFILTAMHTVQAFAVHSPIVSETECNQNALEIKSKIILKILLVEFQDVKHRNPNYPSNLSLPAYTFDDFEKMLFSRGEYVSPNMYSPDGENVFGSLADYYNIMSNGKLEISGFITNEDVNNDNIPDWIMLDNKKAYYHKKRNKEFRTESKQKAKALGLNISKSDNEFLVIIYAGHTYRKEFNTLNPEAFRKEKEYIMGERFAAGSPYSEERDDPNSNRVSTFAHIGIHAHELGHLFGFEDLKGGVENYEWCLMSRGNYNGPNRAGECPAPINPYYRWLNNWISFNIINEASSERICYSLTNPVVYKLQDRASNCFFLVEYRKFNEKMTIGNNAVCDYNSFFPRLNKKYGIFVWRKLTGHYIKLLFASKKEDANLNTHIFPGDFNMRVISPWSDIRVSKPGYYWVPNTKPSQNCAIEICDINDDFCDVDLYQKSPIDSSPSFPKGIKYNIGRLVSLSWENNIEPDLSHYRVYKIFNGKYTFYDTTYTNQYVDYRERYISSIRELSALQYKITAVDKDYKESTFSSEISIEEDYQKLKEKLISSHRNIDFKNYPNPFNNSTTICFTLDKSDEVSLKVYNILGEEVATLIKENRLAGKHEIYFNTSNFLNSNASGVYIFRLQIGKRSYIRKGQLLK